MKEDFNSQFHRCPNWQEERCFPGLRKLGTPRQWIGDTLLAFALIVGAVVAFTVLGILSPPRCATTTPLPACDAARPPG